MVAGKHPVSGLPTGHTPKALAMEEWMKWTCEEPMMQLEATSARAVDVAVELGKAGQDTIILSLLGADEDEVAVVIDDSSDSDDMQFVDLGSDDASEGGWS